MADDGIDGVSLRAVNLAAGTRNTSAAHYHFGSKLGLIEAIVDSLAADVAVIRDPLMASVRARQSSGDVAPREIVEAGYLPFLALFYHREYGHQSIKFLSRLIVDTAPDMRVVVNRFTEPFAREMFDMLTVALPEIPPQLLKARILFSIINLINGSSDTYSLAYSPFGDMTYENPLELASHFLDYMTAGIAGAPGAPSAQFVELCAGLIESTRRMSAADEAE